MLRQLARPRSAALVLVAVLVALGCVRAGFWQLSRYEERQARAELVRAQEAAEPIPLEAAYADGEPVELTRVAARGRYDADGQVLLRYRPQDGQQGYHVLVPLLTDAGAALLVDRGFVPRERGGDAPDVPAPPPGDVEVVGWVRASEDGLGYDDETGTVRRVDVAALGEELGTELLPQWLAVQEEQPPAREPLEPLLAPSTGLGPHLVYAVQWWLFAVVALVGCVLLLRSDARLARS